MKKVFRPSAWLLAFNLVFWVLLFLKYIDYRYEYALYRTMAVNNSIQGDEVQTFKNLVQLTFRIQKARRENAESSGGFFSKKT